MQAGNFWSHLFFLVLQRLQAETVLKLVTEAEEEVLGVSVEGGAGGRMEPFGLSWVERLRLSCVLDPSVS